MALVTQQRSFAAGELAPSLHGRTDLEQFAAGARKLRNFIVTPQGSLVNRSGTQHIAKLPGDASITHRLMPFVYSESDNLVLALFSSGLTRVYNTGADPRHTFALYSEFLHLLGASDLRKLRTAQVGNLLSFASTEIVPADLVRTGTGPSASWASRALSFDRVSFPAFHTADSDTRTPSIVEYTGRPLAGDGSHPAVPWDWVVTYIARDSNGLLFETKGFKVVQYSNATGWHTKPESVALSSDWPVALDLGINTVDGHELYGSAEAGPPFTRIEKARVYRGRDGHYGLVGEVAIDAATSGQRFIDFGAEPDLSYPPPQGANPFKILNADGTVLRLENPCLVAFFEGRRLLGPTAERPGLVVASAVLDWQNFDQVIPAKDSDSWVMTLAAVESQLIRGLMPGAGLFVLTSADEWLITGGGTGDPVTPNAMMPHSLETHRGAAELEPKNVGSSIFFVEHIGGKPFAIMGDANGVRAVDMSVFAHHFFDGYTIRDWAWAPQPFSLLWVARSDGALLSLTYVPEQGIRAWAMHAISDNGAVESLAVKPEAGEHGVYMKVNRAGTRYLERFAYRTLPVLPADIGASPVQDVRYSIHLDRSVSYCGKAGDTEACTLFLTSGDANVGTAIDVQLPSGRTGLVGRVIQIDVAGKSPVRIELGGPDSPPGYYADSIVREAPVNTTGSPPAIPAELITTTGVVQSNWWLCAASIAGLDHLEGRAIKVLADGFVYENRTVTGGSVALPENEPYFGGFAIAHAGVPFNSDFESLDAGQEPGRTKSIPAAILQLENTRGGAVGEDLDNLTTPVVGRRVEDSYLLLGPESVEQRVTIGSKWGTAGRVAFRQDQPLPVTLRGIIREVEYGGRG